jgi:hypothetical protein
VITIRIERLEPAGAAKQRSDLRPDFDGRRPDWIRLDRIAPDIFKIIIHSGLALWSGIVVW